MTLHSCAAGIKQCLRVCVRVCVCVCVCVRKQCFKQGRKGVYRNHSQRKTISIIILGRFCTWYKSRRFFMSLFQLLPIISFVAPPLSKSHVVVTVSNATRTAIRENTGGIDLATYGEARGVFHKYTLVIFLYTIPVLSYCRICSFRVASVHLTAATPATPSGSSRAM